MHIPLFIIVVIGLLFLVIIGALRLVADLLVMNTHRQPSFPDELPEEDPGSEERQISRPVGSLGPWKRRNLTGS
jgi:hypothetical protein